MLPFGTRNKMLLKETLEIFKKLLKECDLTEVHVTEATIIVHSDPNKQEDWQTEYDILIKQTLSHWAIQTIDSILDPYDNVEMEVTDNGLRIFEKEI